MKLKWIVMLHHEFRQHGISTKENASTTVVKPGAMDGASPRFGALKVDVTAERARRESVCQVKVSSREQEEKGRVGRSG